MSGLGDAYLKRDSLIGGFQTLLWGMLLHVGACSGDFAFLTWQGLTAKTGCQPTTM